MKRLVCLFAALSLCLSSCKSSADNSERSISTVSDNKSSANENSIVSEDVDTAALINPSEDLSAPSVESDEEKTIEFKDCDDAVSKLDDALAYLRKAANSDNVDDAQTYARKAQNSFDDAGRAADNCGCDRPFRPCRMLMIKLDGQRTKRNWMKYGSIVLKPRSWVMKPRVSWKIADTNANRTNLNSLSNPLPSHLL